MSLVRRPRWDPLPEPPGPDPALAQEFAVLAEQHAAQLDAGAAGIGDTMSLLDGARADGEAAAAMLGIDLAASAALAEQEERAAGADTLAADLDLAGKIDHVIEVNAGGLGDALGNQAR